MLYDSHRQEWLDSCVSPELIALNVWTIDDPAEADELLNKNTDRRWKHSTIVPGWAVAGISLNSGDRTYQGAQFKPDTPVQIGDSTFKYLSAAGEDSAPLFLDTPNPQYWQGILNNPLRQIILTEGAKKAGASMTVGEATISIPGVYAGQKKGRLKPQLKPFATLGRRWILGFDSDWRTNRNVYYALDRMARLLASTGGVVLFLDLPSETKGIDDFIAANGQDAYQELVDAALTYEEWKQICKEQWESQKGGGLRAVPDDEDAEIDSEANQYIAAEVSRLAGSVDEQFSIDELLPSSLATPLIQVSQRLNVPPAAFLCLLLPICSGRVRVGCNLEIDPSTNYRVKPMLWGCLLGESGSAKSVMLEMMQEPLLLLQDEADKQHSKQLQAYQAELTEWIQQKGEQHGIPKPEEPRAREFYVDDSTMETLAEILTSWPAFGVPLIQDELAGLFNGLNQYKSGGKGSDRQRLLSLYNGGAIKKNRKGARISQRRTSLSITGTTQPHVLTHLMRGVTEADDGLWARFFWALLPPSEMPPPGGGARLDLSPMLESLYRKLEEQTPHTFTLSKEAAAVWRDWHLYTESTRMKEQHPTLRAIYPKARERAARVALVVHFLEWAMQNKTPADQVSGETMAAAVRFVKWSIGQALLIYAEAGVADDSSSSKLARLIKAKEGETLTSVEVAKFFGGRIKAREAKQLMQKIHDLGLGEVFSKGKSKKIKLFNRNKESEAGEADSTQPQTAPKKNTPHEGEARARRVRRIPETETADLQGDILPKSEADSQNASQNASQVRRVQSLTQSGVQEKTPHSPHFSNSSKETGGESRVIQQGDRFVLGGNATAYPKVLKMSDEIFTCTEVRSTKLIGSSDSYKDESFPIAWCYWYPPVTESQAV